MVTARVCTQFKANTKETIKEVARPKAAAALLWWRPKAATFVCALNGASILALSTIYDLRLSKTGRTVVGRTFDWMDGRSDAVSLLSGSFCKGTITRGYRFLNKWPVAISKRHILNKHMCLLLSCGTPMPPNSLGGLVPPTPRCHKGARPRPQYIICIVSCRAQGFWDGSSQILETPKVK